MVYADDTTAEIDADHFCFESAHLKLTLWTMVLLQPREVVVRRLPLAGPRAILGVMADATADEPGVAGRW